MAGKKHLKRELTHYTIKGTTNTIIQAGDCVLMKAAEPNKPPYVASIQKIESVRKGDIKVKVQWYYRPEDAIGGRKRFHGAKELFLSDHYDIQSVNTIEGKCIVHSFMDYTKLEDVGVHEYYSRFEYKAITGAFTPNCIPVYCKCATPYNPDQLMLQCVECNKWYHPVCFKMTIAEAMQLREYFCDDCVREEDRKNSADQA